MIPAEHTPDACPACAAGHPCRIARGRPAAYWRNYRADPGVWGPILLRDAKADRDAVPMPALGTPPTPLTARRHASRPTLDPLTFVTTEQLARDTRALMALLPDDIDLVVGIARSGLFPASLIAYHLHLPLMAVSRHGGLVDPGHGHRMTGRDATPACRVLLVDDTVASGREMAANAQVVRAAFPRATLTRAVVYAHPSGAGEVDHFFASYPGLHYLEWNWCNAGHGEACAYDFDGILCRDFTREECESEPSYRAAMATISPLNLPRRGPVKLIVTGRPESCRGLTLAWLARWGVTVERLVMWEGRPHPAAEEVAPWKARHYKASGCSLFAESDPTQAAIIARESGKPVLCPALGRVLPGRTPPVSALDLVNACEWRGCRTGCQHALCSRHHREMHISECLACDVVAGPLLALAP